MTDDPATHDFDWVTARIECSLPNEFECLRVLVKTNCLKRRSFLEDDGAANLVFSGENGEDEFSVTRQPAANTYGSTHKVQFFLRQDHILIDDRWGDQCMTLTLTLNDEGQCRFVIDGKGEHLRWQVARKALHGLFFDGPRGAAQ